MQSSQIHSRNNNAGPRARNSASAAARSSYKRALCGLLPWRQPETADASPPATTAHGERLLWLSSLKAAAAVVAGAACIYEPLCSTGRGPGVHTGAVAPRRMMTRSPVGRAPEATTLPAGEWDEDPWRAFRRSTLTEDLLMRRFVLKEKAARRRMMMEVAAKGYGRTWMPPPASRLRLMSLAEDDDVAEEEAGESGSSSLRCGQDQPL